jgi:glycosyltransferase involved in cell wall biosynthesis
MRRPTFLLGSIGTPGWGGAATATYTLCAAMQRDGHAVHYANLIDPDEADLLRDALGPGHGNPSGLEGVTTVRLSDPVFGDQGALQALVDTVRPDVLVARGYIAAWVMRRVAPRLPVVFMTSGCVRLKQLLKTGLVADFADFAALAARGVAFEPPRGDRERVAVEGSDLIIFHSPHVRFAYEQFFPAHLGKAYDRLIWVADEIYGAAERRAHLARPFAERDIDVLFVASDWGRHEKNYPVVADLARACPDLRLHLVGLAPDDGLPLQRHGVLEHGEQLFALYGRARTVVCPSRFDAAPGVLFEASAMGCNVVTTPNCGNWQLCHDDLLAPSAAALPERIRRAVGAPLPDRRERFLGSYAELLETLYAFA